MYDMDTSYHRTQKSIAPVRIIFFGTPEFAIPALTILHRAQFEVAAVVTQPDKPAGRGLSPTPSPIKKLAMSINVPVLQPATLQSGHVLCTLKSFDAQVAVCVAYGKIIPAPILALFPRGILNLHPSLLPKYRGPSPIQSPILDGDMETGVTVMLLDAEMDHGPILTYSTYPITRNTTGSELSDTLAQKGAKLLVGTITQYLSGKVTPQPQDHAQATFTKPLTREDGKIDWRKSAEYIERMVRAYDLWPGTWTQLKNMRLKILQATLLHNTIGCANNSTPGYVWKTGDDRLAVNCSPGSVIIEIVQREGKKPIPGAEFLRGSPQILEHILE